MTPRLNVAVAAPPGVRDPADLETCNPAADLIELRLDLLLEDQRPGAVARWIAAAPRPVMATVRSRDEGGAFDGSPEEAARLLEAAAGAGAAWIDAEAAVRPLLKAPDGVRVLASAHGPGAVAVKSGLSKLARPVDDAPGWNALRGLDGHAVKVPYGALGAARVLFEPALLYGAWDERSGVVAGQPSLGALLDELRAGEVGPDAALYGLIGEPPARSPSPAMHNAVFRAWDQDALYVPLAGIDLETALALPFAGFSVTHPYKSAAHDAAVTLSDDARRTAAVNTLVRNADGGWHGDNTDAAGLRSVLDPAPAGATAFVYGTGGFARAAAVALTDLGYGVRLAPRDATYAREASDAVLVNATPSGARGEPLPWLVSPLKDLVVVDAPYADAGEETTLSCRAGAEGAAQVFGGRHLLLAQARFQAALFAGGPVPPGGLERVLAWGLRPPETLVLLGARGAGKTTVGRAVARRCGRPFVDLDAEVERVTGQTPAALIEEEGWDGFREIEAAIFERTLGRVGVVLATGGGVVEHERSRALLARSGFRVHLQVAPEDAAARVERDEASSRPRWPGTGSALEEARVLIERRSPAWASAADAVVDAGRPLDDVVLDVVCCWGEAKV